MQEKHEPLGVHGALPGAPNGPPLVQSAIHRDSVQPESPASQSAIRNPKSAIRNAYAVPERIQPLESALCTERVGGARCPDDDGNWQPGRPDALSTLCVLKCRGLWLF